MRKFILAAGLAATAAVMGAAGANAQGDFPNNNFTGNFGATSNPNAFQTFSPYQTNAGGQNSQGFCGPGQITSNFGPQTCTTATAFGGRPGGIGFGQNQFGQNQFGQNQFGQNQFGQPGFNSFNTGFNGTGGLGAFGTNQFGQTQSGQTGFNSFGTGGQGTFGPNQFGQNQFGQNQFGQNQFGQTGFNSFGTGFNGTGGQGTFGPNQFGQNQFGQNQFGQPGFNSFGTSFGTTQFGQPGFGTVGAGGFADQRFVGGSGFNPSFGSGAFQTTYNPQFGQTGFGTNGAFGISGNPYSGLGASSYRRRHDGHNVVTGITRVSFNITAEVQQSLATLGFDPGPVDGIYGMYTRDGIRDYQRSRGIRPNGRVTHRLLERLRSDVQRYVSPVVDYDRVSSIGPLSRRYDSHRYDSHGGGYDGGDYPQSRYGGGYQPSHGGGHGSIGGHGGSFSSSLVAETQRNLALLGLDPGPADGIAGPATTRAIAIYQGNKGLVPDGRATRALLNGLRNDVQSLTHGVNYGNRLYLTGR